MPSSLSPTSTVVLVPEQDFHSRGRAGCGAELFSAPVGWRGRCCRASSASPSTISRPVTSSSREDVGRQHFAADRAIRSEEKSAADAPSALAARYRVSAAEEDGGPKRSIASKIAAGFWLAPAEQCGGADRKTGR